jgi:hypothetical protein
MSPLAQALAGSVARRSAWRSLGRTPPATCPGPLTLHCYRPAGHEPDSPVVLVQHGMMRNGDDYRDFWIPAADRHGLLIVATTFGRAAWPEAEHYNNGLVLDGDGAVRPRGAWAYGIPLRVFAALRKAGVTTRRKAHLFGHSAAASSATGCSRPSRMT